MRRLCSIALVLLIMVGALSFVHYGPPRFWGDFTGMPEAAVREKLGPPFRDSRTQRNNAVEEYTLGWYQGFEVGMFLTFKDGVVVSQERVSR